MLGIRHEDKSRWERRVPLVPDDVTLLTREHSLRVSVQSSATRAFPDADYASAGARVVADLADCPIILGVKEIPPAQFEPGKTYVYFSHTIKGQAANMPALRRLLELDCNLIDYERITDDSGRRLVFFGHFAGLAGMIDTLWALGRRLEYEGIASPFSRVRPAHDYRDLADARADLAAVGDEVRTGGLPPALRPLICGFAGYGRVSQGAQEIFELLPVQDVGPADLATVPPAADVCYKVVFREEHTVRPRAGGEFELADYYAHPERYEARFCRYLPHLTVLVNGIYWEPKYPRLVTRPDLMQLYAGAQPRLRVIGDISCDVDGPLACTTHTTDPGDPIYVYEPATGETRAGAAGSGPVVLAVDFLPCELPVDASRYFSDTLRPYIPPLVAADLSRALDDSGLPPELRRATIVHQGELTPPYRYLDAFVR